MCTLVALSLSVLNAPIAPVRAGAITGVSVSKFDGSTTVAETGGAVPTPPGNTTTDGQVPGGSPVQVGKKRSPRQLIRLVSFLTPVLLLVAAAFLAAAAQWGSGTAPGQLRAHAFACATVGAALLVLHLLDRRTSGLGFFRPLVGTDGRFSTSLTQLGLWTVAAGTAFAYLLGRVMFEDQTLDRVLPGATWDEYLILLGGPFAAAVLAKGIVTYKLDAGTLQKADAEVAEPAQVVKSDEGAVDLVDSQYLVFNVIALGYFAVEILRNGVLPGMPGPLLAMTSATAGLYVANKAAQRNAPSITSVSPATAEPLQSVTVLGANFDPTGRDSTGRLVSLALTGCSETIYPTQKSDTMFQFLLPAAAAPGKQTLAVTSSAGVQTAPYPIEIRSADILITGTQDDVPLRPGSTVTLLGRNLSQGSEPPVVLVGSVLANATPVEDGNRLTFTVPPDLPESNEATVTVTVKYATLTASQAFPLAQPRVLSAWRQGADALAITATGWRGPNTRDDFRPQVLIDGRPTESRTERPGDPAAPFALDLPSWSSANGEIRVAVVDDLGRKSADYVVPATS